MADDDGLLSLLPDETLLRVLLAASRLDAHERQRRKLLRFCVGVCEELIPSSSSSGPSHQRQPLEEEPQHHDAADDVPAAKALMLQHLLGSDLSSDAAEGADVGWGDDAEAPLSDVDNDNRAPWLLWSASKVCRRWRDVVLHSPEVWRALTAQVHGAGFLPLTLSSAAAESDTEDYRDCRHSFLATRDGPSDRRELPLGRSIAPSSLALAAACQRWARRWIETGELDRDWDRRDNGGSRLRRDIVLLWRAVLRQQRGDGLNWAPVDVFRTTKPGVSPLTIASTGSFPLEYLDDACAIRASCTCCRSSASSGDAVTGKLFKAAFPDFEHSQTFASTPDFIQAHVSEEDLPAARFRKELEGEENELADDTFLSQYADWPVESFWHLPSPSKIADRLERDDRTGEIECALQEMAFAAWGRSSARDSMVLTAPRIAMPHICARGSTSGHEMVHPFMHFDDPFVIPTGAATLHDMPPRDMFFAIRDWRRRLLRSQDLTGLWMGDFHSHGQELIEIEQRGFFLRGRKLVGDPNICAGQTSWFCVLSRAMPEPNAPADTPLFGNGFIQLAARGFRKPVFEQAVVHVYGPDDIVVTWMYGSTKHPTVFHRATPTEAMELLSERMAREEEAGERNITI